MWKKLKEWVKNWLSDKNNQQKIIDLAKETAAKTGGK